MDVNAVHPGIYNTNNKENVGWIVVWTCSRALPSAVGYCPEPPFPSFCILSFIFSIILVAPAICETLVSFLFRHALLLLIIIIIMIIYHNFLPPPRRGSHV